VLASYHVGFRRAGASWIADFSMKASKAAPSMVYHFGRAPEHGAGQGIEQKLMARPLATRCVTFFFDQCCARHYNSGSHEAVLK